MSSLASLSDKCNLVLYHTDKRISDSGWSDAFEISLSKQSTKKTNNTISGYFQLQTETDKNLFKSVFSTDIQLNWFEFKKKDSPDITYGIKILGNRNIVFVNSPETYEALDKSGRKLHVTVKYLCYENEYDLSLEDLQGARKNDPSLVALYNSDSFIRQDQCSTNMGFARYLEVIDPDNL